MGAPELDLRNESIIELESEMEIKVQDELADFTRFIREKSVAGAAFESLEEALDVWREETMSPETLEDNIVALRQVFEEIDAGMVGTPIAEFDRAFRQRHKLPQVQ